MPDTRLDETAFPSAPFPASTSDVTWNAMRDMLLDGRRLLAALQSGTDATTPYITDIFFGITTETPPDPSQTAYTDARYYVTRAVAPSDVSDATYDKSGTGTDDVNVQEDPLNGFATRTSTVTATNLAELPPAYLDGTGLQNGQGSHLIQEGSMVLVYGIRDASRLSRKWYVFYQLPFNEFVISGNSSRPGVYTGHPVKPTVTSFDSSGSSAVTVSDFGVSDTSVDVLLVNKYEMNKDPTDPTQHDLSTGMQFAGKYLCQDVIDPTTPVFIIEGINYGNCA